MLRETNKILAVVLLFLSMQSCDEVDEYSDKILWGKTNYYTNFLFKQYEPQIMTQTLEIEFNEDAQRLVHDDILFELVEKDENDKIVFAQNLNLYKNGVQCPNTILRIKTTEKAVDLGIEFTGEATEGNHTLFLRVKNSGGIDRIDDTDLSQVNDVVLSHEWLVKKTDIYNPLAKGTLWVCCILIASLIAWRVLARPKVFKTFNSRITLIFVDPEKMHPVKLNRPHA